MVSVARRGRKDILASGIWQMVSGDNLQRGKDAYDGWWVDAVGWRLTCWPEKDGCDEERKSNGSGQLPFIPLPSPAAWAMTLLLCVGNDGVVACR